MVAEHFAEVVVAVEQNVGAEAGYEELKELAGGDLDYRIPAAKEAQLVALG